EIFVEYAFDVVMEIVGIFPHWVNYRWIGFEFHPEFKTVQVNSSHTGTLVRFDGFLMNDGRQNGRLNRSQALFLSKSFPFVRPITAEFTHHPITERFGRCVPVNLVGIRNEKT